MWTKGLHMDFWKLSTLKRAAIAGILSLLLILSGVSTQAIAEAIEEMSTVNAETAELSKQSESSEFEGADTDSVSSGEDDFAESASQTPTQLVPTVEETPVEEPEVWTILLEANGGVLSEGFGEDATTIEALEDGDSVAIPNTFKREGYQLLGWSTVADPNSFEGDETPLFVPANASLRNLSYYYVVLEDGAVRQVDDATAAQGFDSDGRTVQTCDLRARVSDGTLSLFAQWETVVAEQDEGLASGGEGENASSAASGVTETADKAGNSAKSSQSANAEASTESGNQTSQVGQATTSQTTAGQVDSSVEIVANAATAADSATGISALLANPLAVIDSAAGVEDTSALDTAEQNIQAQTILSLGNRRLLPSGLAQSLLSAQPLTTQSDSTLALEWVTSDTTDDDDENNLSLTPIDENTDEPDDAALTLQAKLTFMLTGESDFEAGDVQITIPAQFVTNRSGDTIGSLSIDLPEEPDGSQYFAYRLVTPESGEPYYLITNTRTLDASATGEITLSYSDITPHEVASGATQSGLQATMSVTTDGGSESQNSNALTAQIYTREEIIDAEKNGGTVVAYADAPETVQSALSAVASAASLTADAYVLVRWNTYASARGNQAFTLTMKDDLMGSNHITTWPAIIKSDGTVVDPTGSVVLGTSNVAAENPSQSYEKTVLSNSYIATGAMCYEDVWTAYPKSLFSDGDTYTITNSVTWTVTPTDDTTTSSSLFKTGSITYTNPIAAAFSEGSDYYSITNETLEPHKYATSTNTALNDLRMGSNATVGFTITASGEIMRQTKAADETTPMADIEANINNGTKTIADYYHKQFVSVEAADDVLYLNGDYGAELGSDDYYVSQVSLRDPYVYTYAHIDGDETKAWDYIRTTTGQLPNMALYGLSETEGGTAATWTKLATVSYDENNNRTVTPERGVTGVTVDGGAITLGESLAITRVKLVASTKDYDKIEIAYSPYITLRASSTRIQTLIEELFSYTDVPSVTMRNDATLLAYNGDAVGDTVTPNLNPTSAQLADSSKIIALTYNQTRSAAMKRTDALDNIRYGASMDHSSPYAYLRGVTPQVGVTSRKSMEYDESTDLDTAAMQAKLHYTASVHEQSNVTSKDLYESYVTTGDIAAETSGTWYDLLPAGVEPVLSSITLRDADTIEDAYTITNYKDSGRTLLVVKVNLVPVAKYSSSSDYWAEGFYDEPSMSFDAVYSYADYAANSDEKDELVNVIAFESGNDALGTVDGMKGEYDDATGGSGTEKVYQNTQTAAAVSGVETLMSGLDSSLTEKKPTFVYARNEASIEFDRMVSSSTKLVATDAEGIYRSGTGESANQVNVYAGQGYTYRINVGSYYSTNNIVIYDALESYVPSGEDADAGIKDYTWRGTLVSVDTSKLTAAGVAPVVYYSTTVTSSNLETSGINDSTKWIKATEYTGALANVTAIAIDCSKNSNGKDFILSAYESLPVYIHMTAPDSSNNYKTVDPSGGEDDPDNNSHAFNSAYITMDDWGSSTTYTKVGILPHKVTVSKVWDDGNDQDSVRPEGVTVNLLANGNAASYTDGNTVEPVTLTSSNDWTNTFSNLPAEDSSGNAIRYTVAEDDVDGYTPSYSRTDDTHLVITNRHAPGTVEVKGTVTWEDNDDSAGARPSTVVVRLYANGLYEDSQRVAVDSSGNWSYSFTDLPAKAGGAAITYTVQEETIDCYAVDYSDATISGTTTIIDITNTYSATGMLVINKAVKGTNDISANKQFTFAVELFDPTLTDESNLQPLSGSYSYYLVDSSGIEVADSGGTVSTGGTITLGAGQKAIITGIPANSTYTVTEQAVDGFTLTSSENASGTVTASTTESNAVTASFTNTYSSSGSYQLQVTKVLTGRKLARGQFQFQASLVKDDDTEELVDTTSNLAGSALDSSNQSTADVLFSRINVTNEDLGADGTLTRTYRIREVNAGSGGYTYDTGTEEIDVTLTDNGDGTISATQTPASGSDATFTNTYAATGSFSIEAYKYLSGRALVADEFEFTLLPLTSGAPVASTMTAKNAADGTVSFPSIALSMSDAGNSYVYQVTESAGSDTGVNYSSEVVYYLVEVADDGAGALVATTSVAAPIAGADASKIAAGDPSAFEVTGASPTFTNTLDPGSLSITKTLAEGTTDPVAGGSSFTFKVRLTGEDVASSYTYTVGSDTTEHSTDVTNGVMTLSLTAGQTATITGIAAGTAYQVFEESTSGWQLSDQTGTSGTIAANTTSAATFTNAVASTTATTHLYAIKTLEGEAPASGAFSFTLTDSSNAVKTATNDAAGLVDFGSITFNEAGTYTYTIAETAGNDSTIAYDSTTWTATVVVENTGTTDAPVLSVSSIAYRVEDAADTTATSVPPVFANTTQPGMLTVQKVGVNVTDQNKDDQFTFTVELMNDGSPITRATHYITDSSTPTTTESSSGVYSFTLEPNQTVTFTDLPAGTTYTVCETSQSTGWTQTAAANTRGTVPAGGIAAATITNAYSATGSISLQATKTMGSGALSAGDFSFELLDATGTVLQTVSNLAPESGSLTAEVLFNQIDYDVADVGEHTYTMQEVVPAAATNYEGTTWDDASAEEKEAGGFTYNGVIYGSGTDSSLIQTVTVTVADAGDGKLTVTSSNIDSSGNVTTNFENTVSTGSLKVATTAIGTNEAVKDTEFKYSIQLNNSAGQAVAGSYDIYFYDADGNKVTKEYPDGENAGKEIKQVEFSSSGLTEGITNIKSGEYFVVSGLPAGTAYSVTRMDSTYGFTQVASTNDQGTIEADDTAEVSFTNVYEVDGEVALEATVTLTNAATGNTMTGYTFTFQLYDENNNLLQTKTTSSDGKVTFDAIGFTATDAGTESNPKVHKFKIVQVNDSQKNIVYDAATNWVNVSVYDRGDDQEAKLFITVDYDTSTDEAQTTPHAFANQYVEFTDLPEVGGSGLGVPLTIAVIAATAEAARRMRRRRREE